MELRNSLKPGDLIVATKMAYFKSGEVSQRPGDILMVNNPNIIGSVGGTGLNGKTYEGRDRIGLGCSFKSGTFRMATPDDPGYMATRGDWVNENQEVRRLKDLNFHLAVLVAVFFGLLVLQHFKN